MPSSDRTSVKTPVARSIPPADPICVNAPNSPRCRSGACSTDSSAEPPHSAPAATPCSNRRNTSATTAPTPMVAADGITPISVDAMPISTSEATSSFFRPIRSPRWPAITPPSGRATNPTP